MELRSFRLLMLGLGPIALTACVEPGPAVTRPPSAATAVGVDLGSSSRIPHVAGLAGEGEGLARTGRPVRVAHASMPGISAASAGGAQMDHGSMPGMSAGSAGGAQMAHSGHAHVQGAGTVNSVDAAARKVNVTHDPIPTIGWPSMTMDFAVAPAVDLNAVTPGSRISFQMEQGQGGMYVIQSIAPAAPAAGRRR